MKNLLVIFTLLLFGCNEEYFPEEGAFRDSYLYGTWIRVTDLKDSIDYVEVFTEEGYCGGSSSYSNAQSNYNLAYQGLGGIWFVVEKTTGENVIHSKNRFRYGKWNHSEEYYFEGDTLILNDAVDGWEKLVKYKLQLIYDGYKYIGYDSLK